MVNDKMWMKKKTNEGKLLQIRKCNKQEYNKLENLKDLNNLTYFRHNPLREVTGVSTSSTPTMR